jgi:hypothetical protein
LPSLAGGSAATASATCRMISSGSASRPGGGNGKPATASTTIRSISAGSASRPAGAGGNAATASDTIRSITAGSASRPALRAAKRLRHPPPCARSTDGVSILTIHRHGKLRKLLLDQVGHKPRRNLWIGVPTGRRWRQFHNRLRDHTLNNRRIDLRVFAVSRHGKRRHSPLNLLRDKLGDQRRISILASRRRRQFRNTSGNSPINQRV